MTSPDPLLSCCPYPLFPAAAVRHCAVGAVLRLGALRGGAAGAPGARHHQGAQAVGATGARGARVLAAMWLDCFASKRSSEPGALANFRHGAMPAAAPCRTTTFTPRTSTAAASLTRPCTHTSLALTRLQPRVPPLRPPGLRGPSGALLGPGRGGTALVRAGEGRTCSAGHSFTRI